MNISLATTAGSLENLRLLISNQVDAALVQSDVLALLDKDFPGHQLISEQTAVYDEAVQLIANGNTKIWHIGEINPETDVVYIGPEESGTAKTWKGLCLQDEWYAKIKTKNAPYDEALAEVAKNPNALVMVVSGLNSPALKKANEMAKKASGLRLVSIDDWSFNDKTDSNGNSIYKFVSIPGDIYPELQKAGFMDTAKWKP